MPSEPIPMAKPPNRLMTTMMMLAIASPLTNLAGTIHRAVEIGLGCDALPLLLRLGLVDEPGTEIGIDGHLLARHGVQGEPGRHLGDTGGAVGDDDELDDDQDQEHDKADDHRTPDDEVAECIDDLARRSRRGG